MEKIAFPEMEFIAESVLCEKRCKREQSVRWRMMGDL